MKEKPNMVSIRKLRAKQFMATTYWEVKVFKQLKQVKNCVIKIQDVLVPLMKSVVQYVTKNILVPLGIGLMTVTLTVTPFYEGGMGHAQWEFGSEIFA